MSLIFFLLLLGIFWQPLYLAGMGIYYSSVKKDVIVANDYQSLIMPWFKKLIPLIFGSPTVKPLTPPIVTSV